MANMTKPRLMDFARMLFEGFCPSALSWEELPFSVKWQYLLAAYKIVKILA